MQKSKEQMPTASKTRAKKLTTAIVSFVFAFLEPNFKG